MQAPIDILLSLARLHAAAHNLRIALETERDNAQTDDERGYHARRALRNAFGGFAGQVVTPQPEDLGYDAVTVIA